MIDLARRGCRVLQSNSTAPAIGRLYRRNEDVKAAGLRALTIPARRAINSRATRRGAIKEFLITNLPARPAARPAGQPARRGARSGAGSGVDSTGTTGLTTFPWRIDMMMRAMNGRHRLMAGVIAAVIGMAVPAFAQSTGMVKGKVTDAKNQPVDGAKVVIEFKEGVTRKFEVKTNKKGEYIQIGLQPGIYQITATKDGVGTGIQETKISIGATQQVDITLQAAGAGGGSLSKEEEAFRKLFTEGIEANKAGKHDEAIAKFTEALKDRPDCYACQYNIGGSLMQKQDYPAAEAAFQAAAKLDPTSAEPYNALANLYNATKKFDQAAAMTAEALKRGGGSAGARQPGNDVQPGRHALERRQDRRSEGAVRGGGQGQARLRGRALLGRHGQPERRQDAGSGDGVRDLPEDRADRPVRRAGQEAAPADQAAVAGTRRHSAAAFISAGRAASCARGRGPSSPAAVTDLSIPAPLPPI